MSSVFVVNAQSDDDPTDFLPASPNAAALGNYGSVPVGLNTGTAQFTIPIHEYKFGNLIIPISLNYSSNGIKVDELPSNVGLGWVLNAGGVVTRMTRDKPDQGERWIKPDVPYNSEEMLIFLRNVDAYDNDAQPDIFSFNFNGYTGKFYINSEDKPVLIEPSPLKIELLPSFYESYSPTDISSELKITDPFGVVYWFGGQNAGEVGLYRSTKTNSDGIPSPPYDIETAWYLDRIQHPTGEEVIFEYEKSAYYYVSSISQSLNKLVDENIESSENQAASCPDGTGDNVLPVRSTARITTPVLKRIYSTSYNLSVLFDYTPWVSNILKLDAIKIRDEETGIDLKKFELGYLIVESDSYKNKDLIHREEDLKRLFLQRVTEFGEGGASKPSFIMDYYFPRDLPARLSYAQDFWGYFNGKSNTHLVPNNVGEVYTSKEFEQALYLGTKIKEAYERVGGDRSPSGAASLKGMLKKIIYPTNGSSEFFYEPHSYYGSKIVNPEKIDVQIHLDVSFEDFNGSKKVDLGVINTDQKVNFFRSVQFKTSLPDCDPDFYPHDISASFRIKNKTTGEYVDVYKEAANPPLYNINLGNNYIYTANSQEEGLFFEMKAGNSYEVELKIFRPCLVADVSFSYYKGSAVTVPTNIQVGGVRIEKVITHDGLGNQQIKNYDYGAETCIDCSSGVVEKAKPGIWIYSNRTERPSRNELPSEISSCTYATLYSDTFSSLYSLQGSHITYATVIESLGDGFNLGRTIHHFNAIMDLYPNPYNGDVLPGTPNTNSFGQGQELKTVYQKWEGSRFITLRTIDNLYEPDNRINQEVTGFVSRKFYNYYTNFSDGDTDYDMSSDSPMYYDYIEYKTFSQWHYLRSVTDTQFDENGENPIVKYDYFGYDNPNHLQLTYKRSENSRIKGSTEDITETYIRYPHDFTVESLNGLKNNNIVSLPIKKEKVVNGNQVDGAVINYNSNGQPIEIYQYQSKVLKPPLPHISTEINLTDHISKTTINYEEQRHRIKQVEKSGKQKSGYLWGYEGTKLIAAVQNASSDQVYHTSFEEDGTLSSSFSKTGSRYHNSGSLTISTTQFSPTSTTGLKMTYWYWDNVKQEWIFSREKDFNRNIVTPGTRLDELRVYPAGAQTTTYTYRFDGQLTSQTDPNNLTVYYQYDGFGRLINIIDDEGNKLKGYEYKYADR